MGNLKPYNSVQFSACRNGENKHAYSPPLFLTPTRDDKKLNRILLHKGKPPIVALTYL